MSIRNFFIGLLFITSSVAFADVKTLLVNSVEEGFNANCQQILEYPSTMMSSATKHIFDCTKEDINAEYGHIRLELKVSKNGRLDRSDVEECESIEVTDNILAKVSLCKK